MNRVRHPRLDTPPSLMLKYNAAWLGGLLLMLAGMWWLAWKVGL